METEIFGLNKELVSINQEHADVVTAFMDRHKVAALLRQQQAIDVAFSVVDAPSAQAAAAWCGEVNAEKNLIIKGPLGFWRNLFDKAHHAVKAMETELVIPYEEAVARADKAIRAWVDEDTRQRREAMRLRYEAQKRREEDARLAEAEKLARAGDAAAAERELSRPLILPVTQEETEPSRIKNMTQRKPKLVARCMTPEDRRKFIKWVAEHPTYDALLLPDEKKIAEVITRLDGNIEMPGITLTYVEPDGIYRQRQGPQATAVVS